MRVRLCPWWGCSRESVSCSPGVTKVGHQATLCPSLGPDFSIRKMSRVICHWWRGLRSLTMARGRVAAMTFGWQSSSGHLTLCLGTLSLLKVWAWPMDLRRGGSYCTQKCITSLGTFSLIPTRVKKSSVCLILLYSRAAGEMRVFLSFTPDKVHPFLQQAYTC